MPKQIPLDVQTETVGTVQVVALSGDLAQGAERRLETVLRPLCETPRAQIVIDCHQVGYVNSASIGLFNRFNGLCRENEGKLVLCRVYRAVYDVMEILGLPSILTIVDTREQALAQFETAT
jgi:anti-anti-sigma factor